MRARALYDDSGAMPPSLFLLLMRSRESTAMRLLMMRAMMCCLLMAASQAASQVNFVVPNTAYPTIQSALNASQPGDVIVVWPGVYQENLVWPNHDVSVQGAGIGQSIIDGRLVGPCVTFRGLCTNASVLEGFTLKNGLGRLSNFGFLSTAGGGLYLIDDATGVPAPTVRNCEITFCQAEQASAIYMWNAGAAVFEDLIIQHNIELPATLGVNEVAAIEVAEVNSNPTFRRCTLTGHKSNPQGSASSLIVVRNGASLTLEQTTLVKNTIHGSLLLFNGSNVVQIDQSRILSNISNNGTLAAGFGNFISFRDCLMAQNDGGLGFVLSSATEIVGCTIADNKLDNGAAGTGLPLISGFGLDLRNTIIWNNRLKGLSAPLLAPVQGAYTVDHCDIEAMGGIGPGGLDTNPLFLDAGLFDYRLRPGSPCLDAGNSNPTGGLSAFDLRGLPRVRLGAVDMGCLEGQHMAHHIASAGRVGEGAGGPYDVLTLNGSAGGVLRTVTQPVGTSAVMFMLQPPHLGSPVNFIVYGYLGEAGLDEVANVPLGIGDMSIAPEPLAMPVGSTSYFTFTDNLGTGAATFMPSTPTPWISFAGPVIPFPMVLTFQGIVDEGGGLYRPTNAVILRVE